MQTSTPTIQTFKKCNFAALNELVLQQQYIH